MELLTNRLRVDPADRLVGNVDAGGLPIAVLGRGGLDGIVAELRPCIPVHRTDVVEERVARGSDGLGDIDVPGRRVPDVVLQRAPCPAGAPGCREAPGVVEGVVRGDQAGLQGRGGRGQLEGRSRGQLGVDGPVVLGSAGREGIRFAWEMPPVQMLGLYDGYEDMARMAPVWGSITTTAPLMAGGRALLSAASGVWRTVAIWVARASSATCWRPRSMLVTRSLPEWPGGSSACPPPHPGRRLRAAVGQACLAGPTRTGTRGHFGHLVPGLVALAGQGLQLTGADGSHVPECLGRRVAAGCWPGKLGLGVVPLRRLGVLTPGNSWGAL